MNKQFQVIILGVFGIFIFLGVLFFSGAIKIGEKEPTAQEQLTNKAITIWGTLPKEAVTDAISDFSQTNQMNLSYVEKSKESIDVEISEAIASQRGPDLVLASYDVLLKHQSKFVHIPYTTISDRAYRDVFIDQSRIFLFPDGIVAFPFLVDPLIFYFNRVSYNNVAILNPPATWQEVAENSVRLTRKSGTETILESGLPLGTLNNIPHAKDIFALLLIQAGNPIVTISTDPNNLGYFSSLMQNIPGGQVPIAQYVIEFFTQFSDPLKASYSWNRAMPDALDAFASEQAAQYIGFASEIPQIAKTNPSLNFDISIIPQAEGIRAKKTYGKLYGIAIVKASKEQYAAFQTVNLMKEKDFSEKLLNGVLAQFPIAPARKELFANPPGTQYGPIVFSSAIISAGWFDPNFSDSQYIFETMITQVLRNNLDIRESLEEADARLNDLLN
jgi:maltose-binding protein MalE